ncbi:Hypp6072 [Branchiostoma lanceolatum]|uniref:Hypp6072 protein n=1 Tax=Branchiostoma lanceolatum TaxID=7740 RepID=A0A8J9W5R5_BRALA|nr:Hypp6072 [Branchiostoma lanceolatum]
MANSFYVTLPSDSSMDVFPDNTVTNYRTKLAHPVELDGEWEVGLVEIQYPHSWMNVREGENTLLYYIEDEKDVEGSRAYEIVKISTGYYKNILHLLEALNRSASTRYPDLFKQHDMFTYNDVTKRVTMDLPPMIPNLSTTTSYLMGPLAEKLGWDPKSVINGSWIKAPRAPDPNLGFHSLYVYGDIVQHRLVGDVKVPLLRIIKVSGEDGEIIDHPIITPHYIPLSKRRFETVEIDIRNELGHPVPFVQGRAIVTLHLRQRRSSYFT